MQAAARAAGAGKKDFETLALKRAKKLEPKLSRITLKIARPSDAMEIKRDGEVVNRAEWGVAALVDAGAHRYEAIMPGAKGWRTTISIEVGENKTLEIPPLGPETSTFPAAPPDVSQVDEAAPGRKTGSTQRAIGLGVAGLGVAGVVVGSVFGLKAISRNDDASKECRTETLCSPQGVAWGEDAQSAARVSTIAFGAGGALLVAGMVLFFTAPSATNTRAATLPRFAVVPGGAVVGAGASW
jgi:hypothetical protein